MAVGDLSRIRAVDQAYVPNTLTTAYTIPASRKAVSIIVDICNSDASLEYLFDLHFVPSGGSADATNRVQLGVAGITGLRAGESRILVYNTFLEAADFISWKANTASKITGGISVVLEEV